MSIETEFELPEVGESEDDDPSLALLFAQIRLATLQTAKGTSEISEKTEFDFVLHNAWVFTRMGSFSPTSFRFYCKCKTEERGLLCRLPSAFAVSVAIVVVPPTDVDPSTLCSTDASPSGRPRTFGRLL